MNSFLYARPSFLLGIASLLDFGNTLFEYNYSNTPEQADFIALQSDWIVVGEDLRAAMEASRRELVSIGQGQESAPPVE